MEPICTTAALPEGSERESIAKQSDLKLHPSGRTLYSLIRGLDAIAVFAVTEETGTLELVQTVELDARGPRGCAISPDGRFMLIAALEARAAAEPPPATSKPTAGKPRHVIVPDWVIEILTASELLARHPGTL